MKTLVVYYSRTEHTKRIAQELASRLGADLEELRESRPRRGLRGYLRAALEALLRLNTSLQPTKHPPGGYDLVVVGSPVWNASVSSPVRTYLRSHRTSMSQVATFCTHGGMGARRALRQMRALLVGKPLAALSVNEREIVEGRHLGRLELFVKAVARRAPEPTVRITNGAPEAGRTGTSAEQIN